MPEGREYLGTIQPYHFWTRFEQCGACAFWQGSNSGGYPGTIEPLAQVLNPLVAISVLAAGVVNGSKLAMVAALVLAGAAQWWLGQVLGMGRVARVWSAGMLVVAGHLVPKAVTGPTNLLSLAACTLILPPTILLFRSGGRRVGVLLGTALGLAAIGGPGYPQVGFLFSFPAVALLIRRNGAPVARRLALAVFIALLLVAPFLIPFLHFAVQISKGGNPTFPDAQPLAYVPLNLVIGSPEFYGSTALNNSPAIAFPAALYIGWIAVLLAVWGLIHPGSRVPRQEPLFLAAFAFLAMWTASAAPLRALVGLTTMAGLQRIAEIAAGVEGPSATAAVAVSPILALAGLGVDGLLTLAWPRLSATVSMGVRAPVTLRMDLRWLLAVPLVFALFDARAFSSNWIHTHPLDPAVPAVVNALKTPHLEIVSVPGEQYFYEQAADAGLKLTNYWRGTWTWKDRSDPSPSLLASRDRSPPPGMDLRGTLAGTGINIYAADQGSEYATVAYPDGGRTACAAHGIGGDISVACELTEPGTLTLAEHSWTGWQAIVDGAPVPLIDDQWLRVAIPAGSHAVEFRYRPWDVPLGIVCCLIGIIVAILVWRHHGPSGSQSRDGGNSLAA